MDELITLFKRLIEDKNYRAIRNFVIDMTFVDIAEVLEELPAPDYVILFRLLPRELAKETFQELSLHRQELIVQGLAENTHRLAALLNDLDPDDRTAFFEELPGVISQRLIQLLSPEERKITTKLMGYPEESIGRLMTPHFVAVKSSFPVAKALEHIKKHGKDSETLNVIYVIDNDWTLLGNIELQDLVLANSDDIISDIMDTKVVSLKALDDEEEAIQVFKDHDMVVLPVTDSHGTLLGIVTIDDIMDLIEEENTEDFHKFGALNEGVEDPGSQSVFFLYKQRIIWLFALVFMNVFSGAAIAHFDTVISKYVSLIFFLPLLIASGGNAGAQTATLMIRSLATGDVEIKDWFRLVGKEFITSLLLGITMAAGVAVIAGFRAPQAMLTVALTMIATVICGSIIGLSLPFIFTILKLDPATASAPLITSLSDILGVVIYFNFATLIMG